MNLEHITPSVLIFNIVDEYRRHILKVWNMVIEAQMVATDDVGGINSPGKGKSIF